MANIFVSEHPQMALYGALATKQKWVNGQILLNKVDHDRFYELQDEDDIVMVFSGVNNALSEKELAAIVAHEEGHVHHKHLEGLEAGLMDDLSKEIEADAYAAEKCGASTLYRALRKTVLASVQAMAAEDEMSSADIFGMLRGFAINLRPRFAALRAAM